MHLIEITPAPCLNCGKGNAENRHGERPQFVDLERDTNWNDPAILCEDCCISIGALIGMVSPDQVKDLRLQLRRKDHDIHAIRAEKDEMQRRAKKLGFEFVEEAVA
jgi:hypothetical protein